MKLNSIKKFASAIALGLTLAVVAPSVAPATASVLSVEAATTTTTTTTTQVGLNKKSTTLKVGQKEKLTLSGVKGSVKWSTSKKSVATVSKGTVTAVSKGKATITAKVGKKKYTCKVTVKANKLTEKTPSISQIRDYGVTYSPVSYEYKNGKFVVTVKYYNNTSSQKVTKLGKTTLTVKAKTLAPSSTYPYYKETETVIAKASFGAKSFSLAPKKTKNTTFTFSGNKIKQRVDLSQYKTLNYIDNNFATSVYSGYSYLDIEAKGKYYYRY